MSSSTETVRKSAIIESPLWWKEAVIYQIYPRSFQDSNGDGIGDLTGIRQRLDYIQSLGVGAIWLSPIFASPNDDNGYDISDYQQIHPDFGTLDDFDAMLADMKKRGLRLLLDGVINHTSDEHPWFVESRSSRSNPKRNWYHWHPGRPDANGMRRAPNNWKSVFEGSAWEWDETTGEYFLHNFSRKQPDLNWTCPELREAVCSMLSWWLDRGVDGFRLDVINMLAKVPGYPDMVPGPGEENAEFLPLHQYACNQEGIHDYLREINQKAFAGRDCYTVGETWWVGIKETLEYTNYDSHELDSLFQFYFHEAKTGRDHFEHFSKLYTALKGKAWLTVTLGNHDSRRQISKFGDPIHHPRASATLLATWLLTLPATPFLLQGEELGMTDVRFPSISDYRDIQTLNRYKTLTASGKSPIDVLPTLQLESRDNSRTPMQWDASPNAAFTTGVPWIGNNPNYATINAAAAQSDPGSILQYYRILLRLRKKYPSLVYGDFEPVAEATQVLTYRRGPYGTSPAMRIALNWCSEKNPTPATMIGLKALHGNYLKTSEPIPDQLQPWEAVIAVE